MNNSEKKRRLKINIIDILLIAIFIFIAALAVYFIFFKGTPFNGSNVDINYTIDIDILDQKFLGNIKIGDKVTENVKTIEIGEITRIEVLPAYVTALNEETGEMNEKNIYPGHKRVKVHVKAKAQMVDGRYNVNGVDIGVGEKLNFRVPDFISSGFCTELLLTKDLPQDDTDENEINSGEYNSGEYNSNESNSSK